mgnify:CR=1 FL=1
MAKKKKEEVVEETTDKQPKGKETKGDITKVKATLKQEPQDLSKATITKVDLNKPEKPEENEVKENNANDSGVVAEPKNAEPTQEQKEVQPEAETQEAPALEEVTEDSKAEEAKEAAVVAEEAIKENLETGKPLPENVQKLMNFMEETGGDLNDYVKLNQDYSAMDNQTVLEEYYKQTKPHLTAEERNFLMEDQFSYNEDEHSELEIKRKKLALKEQVASARSHLDGQKSKYYEEIKLGSKLTNDQQEAINFYKQSQKYQEEEKIAKSRFLKQTDNVFNSKFKGFEYNVGDKKYRFNVNDVNKTKEAQSDINNFIGKFLNEKNEVADAAGYHKALFTASNSDAIAKHFYEQGKADALKESVAKSKNVSMDPRQELTNNIDTGGIKVKVLGESSSDFKFKIKNNK